MPKPTKPVLAVLSLCHWCTRRIIWPLTALAGPSLFPQRSESGFSLLAAEGSPVEDLGSGGYLGHALGRFALLWAKWAPKVVLTRLELVSH